MRSKTRHLSFANVVSVIALFVALGGSALAVQVAQKNSVTSKSIRNNTIRSADLKDGQVTTTDVADGSLSASDIDVASLGDATTGRTKQSFSPCTQTLTSYQSCISSDVTLDRAGRIYATADGNADSGAASVPVGVNTCRLVVDGAPFTTDFVIAADFSPGEAFSFAGVTEQLAAGVHTVRMDCKGNGTLPGPRIFTPTLTTLELGSG